MGGPGLIRILLMVLVVAAFVVGIVLLISKVIKTLAKQAAKKSIAAKQQAAEVSAEEPDGPRIVVAYERDGGVFEDGKCGWLDLEREDGDARTVKLNFNKKSPAPIVIPLETATYRITYRTQSKAAMAAGGVLNAINEGNGAMGSFANAVYDAGGMNGELESVVVKVEDGFVLRLLCTTDGLTKSCKVVSAKD